jgi:F-type H+-transporting ATPase subunit b
MTMDFNILNDATLWVGISFLIFILLIFRPMKKQVLDSLDKRIIELKSDLEESKKLKNEAESLFEEHIRKQVENTKKIENLKLSTKKEIEIIKDRTQKDIESTIIRKKENFEQMTSQMELKMIDQLKSEILKKTIMFTETRIKKKLGNKHNKKLIDESLQKLTNHFS